MPDQLQKNPNLPPSYYLEEDTISFIDILLVLARQLKVIIITPIITCIVTIIYALNYTSPVYTSEAKIISSSGGSAGVGIAAQFGINLPRNNNVQWVYPEIVKSRTLARKMLKRKFDTIKYGPQKSLLQILTYGNGEPTVGIDTLMQGSVSSVIGMIELEPEGSFFLLKVTAAEPVFARDLAFALIEELDNHQREYNSAKVNETRQFIEERIQERGKELMIAEETLKEFRVRNRNIGNSPTLQLEQARLQREVNVLMSVFTSLKQQLENTKIEEVKKSDYVIVLDPPEAPLKRSAPNRRKMVILGGWLGILFGLIIAFIKNYFESSIIGDQEKTDKFKSLFINNLIELVPIFRKKLNVK